MKTGILGATILIISTTIDDAIWLVPYCTSSHLPLSTKIIHALTFVLTLEFLSIGCIGLSYLMKHGLKQFLFSNHDGDGDGDGDEEQQQEKQIGFYMECIGAMICWIITIFLFVKKMLKRRRKRLQKLQKEEEAAAAVAKDEEKLLLQQQEQQPLESMPSLGQSAVHSYTFVSMDTVSYTDVAIAQDENSGLVGQQQQEEQFDLVTNMDDVMKVNNDNTKGNGEIDDDDDDDDDINKIPSTPSIPIVISFTTLGALDEISYFPALIMGKIFTPMELCVGAFLASIIILIVINVFLVQCKPLVDCLDRIPLYGIVGMFAVVLTVGLFF